MTSIVIGGIGSAVATGMGRIGIETIPGVIGPDKRFIGHHQDILATEDLMGSQWLEGLEDRMENQVDTGLMEDQVDQGLVARRVGRVVPVEADLTLKCMEDHKAKSVDLDLSPKRLADLVADLRARLVGTLIKKVGKMWLT